MSLNQKRKKGVKRKYFTAGAHRSFDAQKRAVTRILDADSCRDEAPQCLLYWSLHSQVMLMDSVSSSRVNSLDHSMREIFNVM